MWEHLWGLLYVIKPLWDMYLFSLQVIAMRIDDSFSGFT